MMMGKGPPGQPCAENQRCTASSTSMWKIPSSESSSGNMAEPRERDARSFCLDTAWWSEPDGGLFLAPSRFTGVLPSDESEILHITNKLISVYQLFLKYMIYQNGKCENLIV